MASLNDLLSKLPSAQREKIISRGNELYREAITLQALRANLGLSQGEIARKMGVKQPRVSKVEKTALKQLSALEEYVQALGGVLEVYIQVAGRRHKVVDSSDITAYEDVFQRDYSDTWPAFAEEIRRTAISSSAKWGQNDNAPGYQLDEWAEAA